MTELIVDNVQKWLGGLQILKGASLRGERGSITALLGASGSGKTTLLRCIAGLEQPEIGHIRIGDKVALDSERRIQLPPEARNIGLVFQSYALWPHRTVRENVGYGLKLRGANAADMDKRIADILQRLGLAHLADRYPSQLSGGQQQRVAIARSLAMRPKVMLFDEVTSALDPELTGEVLLVMEELAREGMTMLLVTHEMNFARSVADITVFMHQGKIWEIGPSRQLFDNPQTPELQAFLSSGVK